MKNIWHTDGGGALMKITAMLLIYKLPLSTQVFSVYR